MHIPSSTTDKIDILSFEEALVPSSAADYDRSRWIYVPDFYSEYRYILGTRGKHPLICIGINPSTAEPDNLDNTLKSAQRIANYNGYDSFIMFNVYAQRATNPDHMEKVINPALHAENMKAFEYVLRLSEGCRPAIWAAWGAIIEKRRYLFECVGDMVKIGQKYGVNWFTAGNRSKVGHPHHPLYLPKNSVLEPFDPLPYIDTFLPPTL